MDFDVSLIDEFVAESREHLQTIEEDLLTLEKQKAAPDGDLVAHVFRAIHSVKGAAGFLGLNRINELAHIMETILSMVRDGEMVPESACVNALLHGADLLGAMVDDVRHSNAMDISGAMQKLRAVIDSDAPKDTALKMDTKVGVKNTEGAATGFVINELLLERLPRGHEYLYILSYDLTELARQKGPSPLALIRRLASTGFIVDARIDTDIDGLGPEILDSPVRYEVLYSSLLDPDLVGMAVDLPRERIRPIPLDQGQARPGQAPAAPPDPVCLDLTPSEPVDAAAESAGDAGLGPDGPEEAPRTEAQGQAPQPRTDTIRIPVELLDTLMTLAGELVLVRNQQLLAMEMGEPVTRNMIQRLDVVTSELQESIMRTRMQPIGNVFGKIPRIVRDLSQRLGRQIRISISGSEVELDKTILELLADPLIHLTRNCCDHGIEPPDKRQAAGKPPAGLIKLGAFHEGGQINIVLEDDGRGLDLDRIRAKAVEKGLKTPAELAQMPDKEIMGLIMLPGFSTADKISDVSGRGVGMDVVKTSLEKLGGTIELESQKGRGTKVHLRLPLTLAIIPCLLVRSGDSRYAIPQFNLEELVCLYDDEVRTRVGSAGNQEVCRLRDELLPLTRLGEVLADPEAFSEDARAAIVERYRRQQEERRRSLEALRKEDPEAALPQSLNFAVVRVGGSRFGLIVDKVIGTEEIVVKPMHPALKDLDIYSGATVMGDGQVALILDIEGVARHSGVILEGAARDAALESKTRREEEADRQTVLLFKNGDTEQFAVALPLIRRIERISLDQVETVGQREFITIDDTSTMVLRLDQVLKVSKAENGRTEAFLLLPKFIKRPFGILMSRLVDIEETPVVLNTQSYMEDGLLGTDIVRGHMTLFIDLYRLVEKAEPDWFAERRGKVPAGERKRVLVVEDGSFFRQLVKGYLESDGYAVVTAENGRKALEKLEETPDFDLIVSDLQMPEMDGFDFIRAVRSSPVFGSARAMALTSLSSDKDRKRAKECGFDHYEVKLDREQLLTTVAAMLNP